MAAKGGDERTEEWTDEEIESFLFGFLLLTVVAITTFFIYIRPRRPNHTERDRLVQENQLQRNLQILRQRRDQDGDRARSGGTGVQSNLIDGIISFRNTDASKWSPADADKNDFQLKQSQTFQSIFKASNIEIPTRGCNLVVTLREKEWIDVATAQVLTQIGANYNLFIILDVSRDEKEPEAKVNQAKETLRNNGLIDSIIPSHRIIASQSIAGRIAFVRQLRPEIILDYENEVKTQLTRFGFRVLVTRRVTGESLGVFLSTE